ncbi:hypothetical protein [Pseudomonas sp. zfem003]|uniref:hypothetical protein n=1 Tax=Pseudomonas sp. zfem003 TaxID=3078198 RepID=UPI0029283460|nr:hypothetical protein [Pseudomonas sp. zfem003]MDU9398090.1 hypothetical protein [Pseudomonas sp. zfem003]MDU9399012.1 hypothetical protein [Pseudomonas sp. zfem003]
MGALLIANAGTPHELTISVYHDRTGQYFRLDNTPDRTGSQLWHELPREYGSIAGCKRYAARLFGTPQKWEEPTPPQENDR